MPLSISLSITSLFPDPIPPISPHPLSFSLSSKAALLAAGTIIQNWGKKPISTFAAKGARCVSSSVCGVRWSARGGRRVYVFTQLSCFLSPLSFTPHAGFAALDSTYTEMYLNEQCCSTAPPRGTHDKYKLCYWRDHGQSVEGTALRSLMDGGEVAMWSDNYCGAPHCEINGTYGWMYDADKDHIFSESFGNAVFPGAAAAAGSLWHYNVSLSPHGLPSTDMTDAINAHTARLQARGVPTCAPGCACDWGSSCIGDPTKFYRGTPTPYNVDITVVNTNCDFNVHLKKRTPCSTLTGGDLAVVAKGQTATFHGSDFIASGIDKTVEKDGDQFSVWVGDGTWMNVKATLSLTCDDTTYINMAPI